VPNAKFRGDSPRSGFYQRRIKRWLDAQGFGPRQRARIESVGWSKLKEYAHLLDRQNFQQWTRFAERDDVTAEIVQQAVERGRPVMPSEPIRTVMFRLPESLKDALNEALAKRRRPREAIDQAVRRLLRDAGAG
jgi:hypothetical protein